MSKIKPFRALLTTVLTASLIITSIAFPTQKVSAFTQSNADTAMQAYNSAYWNSAKNLFWDDTNHTKDEDIWVQACEWDMIMDAYERTNDSSYLTQLNNMYQGGKAKYASFDWYDDSVWFANDDMLWWIIGMLRAYEITGNNEYLTTAKAGVDRILDTEFDTSDGGIWWTSVNHYTKNSCAECPFVIAACKLAQDTGDSSYLQKAETVYNYQRSNLYNTTTGSVYDSQSFPDEDVDTMNFCYNQGTMIGAGLLLYEATNNASYLTDSKKACDYLKNVMCDGEGILPAEMDMNDQGISKAIAVRYVMMLVNDENQTQYLGWLEKNADMAWQHRDTTRNLTTRNWNTYAGTDNIYSCEAAGLVGLLQVLPANTTSNYKDPYTVVEAENYDAKTSTMSLDVGNGADKNIGGIQNNNYIEYKNVNFGSNGANGFKARVSVNNDASGYIDIRLGSTTGTLVGTLDLYKTGSWSNYRYLYTDIQNVTGIQDVYLVFRTKDNYQFACNLDKFYFTEANTDINPYKFQALEAAQCSSKSSTIGLGTCPDGGLCLNNVQNNTYVAYNNVDFGTAGAAAVNMRVATSSDARGQIEVRLDGTNGQLLTTLTAPEVGSWDDYYTITANLSGATGKHNVYFVFKTDAGMNYVCNVRYIEFKGYSTTYEAEGSLLQHGVGRIEGNGVGANTNDDSQGHLVYGPYKKAPEGERDIVYRMMVDDNSSNNDVVAVIDVYDSSTNTTLAEKEITRSMFNNANTYQDFHLNFKDANSTSELEYRVLYKGNSHLNVDYITVM